MLNDEQERSLKRFPPIPKEPISMPTCKIVRDLADWGERLKNGEDRNILAFDLDKIVNRAMDFNRRFGA